MVFIYGMFQMQPLMHNAYGQSRIYAFADVFFYVIDQHALSAWIMQLNKYMNVYDKFFFSIENAETKSKESAWSDMILTAIIGIFLTYISLLTSSEYAML